MLKGKIASHETENEDRQKWIIRLNNGVKDGEAQTQSQKKEIEHLKLEAERKTLESNQTIGTLENELALKETEIQSSIQRCRDLEAKILNQADRYARVERKHKDENAYLKFELQKLQRVVEEKEMCNRANICDLKEKLVCKEEELQQIKKLHSRSCQELADRDKTISTLKEIARSRNEQIECLEETVESLENKVQLDELRCSQLEIIIRDEVEDHEAMKKKFRHELIQKLSNDESSRKLIGELLQEKTDLEESLLRERAEVEEGLEREKVLKEEKDKVVVENQESLQRESQLIEVNNKLGRDSEAVEDLNRRNKELEKLWSQQRFEYEKQLVAVKEKFDIEIEALEADKKDLQWLLSKEKGFNSDLAKREKGLLKENNRIMLKNEALRHKSGKLEELLTDERNMAKERKVIVERLEKVNEELERDRGQNQALIEKQAREYNELWDKGRKVRHENDVLVADNQHWKARFEVKTIECQKLVCKIGKLRKDVNGGVVEMRHYQLQQNKLVIARDALIEEYKEKMTELMKAVKVERMVNQVILKENQDTKAGLRQKETELEDLQNKLKATEEKLNQLHQLENDKLQHKNKKYKGAKKCRSKDELETLDNSNQGVKKDVRARPKSNSILTKMDVAQHKVAKQQQRKTTQPKPLTTNLDSIENKITKPQNEGVRNSTLSNVNQSNKGNCFVLFKETIPQYDKILAFVLMPSVFSTSFSQIEYDKVPK